MREKIFMPLARNTDSNRSAVSATGALQARLMIPVVFMNPEPQRKTSGMVAQAKGGTERKLERILTVSRKSRDRGGHFIPKVVLKTSSAMLACRAERLR